MISIFGYSFLQIQLHYIYGLSRIVRTVGLNIGNPLSNGTCVMISYKWIGNFGGFLAASLWWTSMLHMETPFGIWVWPQRVAHSQHKLSNPYSVGIKSVGCISHDLIVEILWHKLSSFLSFWIHLAMT